MSRLGFKISRHSGQQYLTFKPAKSVYSYTLGGKPYYPKSGQFINATIAQYSDFLNFSDMALETAIDPVVEAAAGEMAKTAAETLNNAIKTTMCSVWSNYTPTKPFLIHPQILKDIQSDPTFEGLLS